MSEIHSHNEFRNTVVNFVLTCVDHIGWLIVLVVCPMPSSEYWVTFRQAEEDDHMLNDSSPKVSLELWMGMYSAVAASFASCLTDLLKIASKIIKIALRLKVAIIKRATFIEKSMKSWFTVLVDVKETEALRVTEKFNQAQVWSVLSQISWRSWRGSDYL